MKEFWDQRYSTKEYVYGKEPNAFFKQLIENLKPGKILFPAEGEGRNAVYAAKLGWEVYAFDQSEAARKKAEKLSRDNKVSLNYAVHNYDDVNYPENSFDCVVLIFAHFPPELRILYHHNTIKLLKPGGTIILEGFSKNQINKNTGGPKNIRMLYSENELKNDFRLLNIKFIRELDKQLREGPHHDGKASVIQLVAEKNRNI